MQYECGCVCVCMWVGHGRGVHSPWGNDAFPLCFRFPPCFRKMFSVRGKFPKFYLFLKNFSIFIHQNFWWSFLVINHKFRISPLFSLFQYISLSISTKLFFPPYFYKFPLCFQQIYLFFTYFMCFSFPTYFYHDAFMHHTMPVLDAPGSWMHGGWV